jgi:hypothetical protein
MAVQALVIALDLHERDQRAVFFFAVQQSVVAHRLRLRSTDNAAVDAIGGGQGQLALEAAVERELHFAEGLRLLPAQLDPRSLRRHHGRPAVDGLAGDVAGDAVEDVVGFGMLESGRSLDARFAGQVGGIFVAEVFDRLIVAQQRLLQLVEAGLVFVEPARRQSVARAQGRGRAGSLADDAASRHHARGREGYVRGAESIPQVERCPLISSDGKAAFAVGT